MSYATPNDVQALNRQRVFGQGKNPTEDDVKTFLELSEAEINAILVNKGLSVPVVKAEAPAAYAYLRKVNAQGALMLMERSAGNGPNLESAENTYQQALSNLEKSQTVLDAPLNVARAEPRGPGVTQPNMPFAPGQVYNPNELPTSSTGGVESGNRLAPYISRSLQF